MANDSEIFEAEKEPFGNNPQDKPFVKSFQGKLEVSAVGPDKHHDKDDAEGEAIKQSETVTHSEDISLLITQSQSNNRKAFNRLVIRYQDVLYNMVYRLADNANDAMDICQEVFIRAFQNIRGFRGESSFQTWLYQIALNQYYTHYQKTKKDKAKNFDYVVAKRCDNTSSVSSDTASKLNSDPAQQFQAKERNEVVQSALDSLPPDLKKVVVLKDMEGLSYEEIAHILRVSVHNVRSRLCEARQQLRETLKKYL